MDTTRRAIADYKNKIIIYLVEITINIYLVEITNYNKRVPVQPPHSCNIYQYLVATGCAVLIIHLNYFHTSSRHSFLS